jgi:hypothetical protein
MKIKLFQHPTKTPHVKLLGPGHEAEQVKNLYKVDIFGEGRQIRKKNHLLFCPQ